MPIWHIVVKRCNNDIPRPNWYLSVDASGRLVGLVTSETVGEMLMLGEVIPKGAE
jgi:hypothetical protein